MSAELSVKATPIIQPPTQDAISKTSNEQSKDSKVSPLSAKAPVDSLEGKTLPRPGSDAPGTVSEINTTRDDGKIQKKLSTEDVLEAVKNLNDFVQNTRRELNFSVDEQTGRTVVKVIDHETKDVIRQIPAEEILEVARRVAEEKEEKGNLLKVEV